MNIKALAILSMVFVQSSYSYNMMKPHSYDYNVDKPSLTWAYFWKGLELNPTFELLRLSSVDCKLVPNLVHWVAAAISFDSELNFDFLVIRFGEETLNQIGQLKAKCQNLNILIDPEFTYNQEFEAQLTSENIPIIVNSFLKFCSKYSLNGLVISFEDSFVLDDAKTYAFFKELKSAFDYNNLKLVGYFINQNGFRYVRPVVFKFLHEILIEVADYETTNELVTNLPTVGPRSYENIIEKFINYGADVEKISLQMAIFGSSYKRTSTKSPTSYDLTAGQPQAAGFGSFLYSNGLITDKNKNFHSFNLHTAAQICKIQEDSNWTKATDMIQKTPYAFTDGDWISFDNKESFKHKVDTAKSYKIKGVFLDAINYDDFSGSCGKGPYPMTNTVLSLLNY